MINIALRDTVFVIPDVIELQTQELHNTAFDWRHYGGLLGLYQLCRFTRFKILNDEFRLRQNIPPQQRVLFQQGDLILEQLDEVPSDAVPVSIEPDVDGSIDLENGHKLRLNQKP
jgi:hypothetical protein